MPNLEISPEHVTDYNRQLLETATSAIDRLAYMSGTGSMPEGTYYRELDGEDVDMNLRQQGVEAMDEAAVDQLAVERRYTDGGRARVFLAGTGEMLPDSAPGIHWSLELDADEARLVSAIKYGTYTEEQTPLSEEEIAALAKGVDELVDSRLSR